jgi:hypothetical protein
MSSRRLIPALAVVGVLALAASAEAASPPAALHCGQTLTHNVKLTADLLDCPGDGLVIGADEITVDLNGHTIDGVPASGCDSPEAFRSGVRNSGHDGVTVERGTVQQFDFGVDAGSMSDSRFHDLVLRDNRFAGIDLGTSQGPAAMARNLVDHNRIAGVSCGGGIGLNTGQENRFAHNEIENVAGGGIGVCCGGPGDRNVVDHNRIAGTGTHGILVFISGSSRVAGNVLSDIGLDPSDRGDAIMVDLSSNAVVTDNRVTRAHWPGIFVAGCIPLCGEEPVPTGVRVERNTLEQTGDGIFLFNTDDDVVRGNSVTRAGSLGDPNSFGVGVLLNGVSDTVVRANAIADSRGIGAGIVVGLPPEFGPLPRPVHGNVVTRNLVTGQHADGIFVAPVAQDTILARNTANDNAADGIHVLSPSTLLRRNVADGNGAFGIEAVDGVIDAGGNEASGNGNPAQCTGVACG